MSYYKLNFDLMHNHGFSLTELDNMMPWERDVFVSLLMNDLNEKASKKENAAYG